MAETIPLRSVSNEWIPARKESSMHQRDATLAKQAAAGSESAFRSLVEAHGGMVYNLALKIIGDPHEAEDVFQDVFLGAWRGLGGFRGEAKFSTWLCSITINRCRRVLSSRRRAVPAEPLEGTSLADKSNPAAGRAVREALALIPEKFRIAVVLHCMSGYTYREAGAIMNVPDGTVKSYVHRGKRALRRILQDNP